MSKEIQPLAALQQSRDRVLHVLEERRELYNNMASDRVLQETPKHIQVRQKVGMSVSRLNGKLYQLNQDINNYGTYHEAASSSITEEISDEFYSLENSIVAQGDSKPLRREKILVEPLGLNRYGIRRGFPSENVDVLNPNTHLLRAVPNNPHVVYADSFELVGRNTSVKHKIGGGMVMIGHGFVDHNGIWRSQGTDKTIIETVKAYEDYAKAADEPPLDVLFICNDDSIRLATRQTNKLTTVSFEWRDIPYIYPRGTATAKGVLFIPGSGINNLVIEADSWNWIGLWQEHRNSLIRSGRNRPIPSWAKNVKSR